mmetsp:Transcript_25586/g.59420  ORF Transcript_25586/g.59420 Transcript_25586/m.59420 type:complete len:559 (-) Transcript_25586:57-1733(-)
MSRSQESHNCTHNNRHHRVPEETRGHGTTEIRRTYALHKRRNSGCPNNTRGGTRHSHIAFLGLGRHVDNHDTVTRIVRDTGVVLFTTLVVSVGPSKGALVGRSVGISLLHGTGVGDQRCRADHPIHHGTKVDAGNTRLAEVNGKVRIARTTRGCASACAIDEIGLDATAGTCWVVCCQCRNAHQRERAAIAALVQADTVCHALGHGRCAASIVVVALDITKAINVVGVGVAGKRHAGDKVSTSVHIVGRVEDGGRRMSRNVDRKDLTALDPRSVRLEDVEFVASLVGGNHVGTIGNLVESSSDLSVLKHELDVVVADIKLECATTSSALGVHVLVDGRVGNSMESSASSRNHKAGVVKLLGQRGGGKVDFKEELLSRCGGKSTVSKSSVLVPEEFSMERKLRVGLNLGLGVGNVREVDDIKVSVAVGVGPEFVAIMDTIGVDYTGSDLHDRDHLCLRSGEDVDITDRVTRGSLTIDTGVDEHVTFERSPLSLVLHVYSIGPSRGERVALIVGRDGLDDATGVGIDNGNSTRVERPETTIKTRVVLVTVQDGFRGRQKT